MALEITDTLVVPKPAYNVLRRLTGEARPDVALSLALKDLVRLRLDEARLVQATFEKKYKMSFEVFSARWKAGEIALAHHYEVEQDYWNWEAATTDIQALQELAEILA